MKKVLEESLRHMQSHPTTGTPHNQQVISTQVETIFAIDTLTNEIEKLSNKIEEANKQNERLEMSNYNLQVAMLILTAIGTAVVISPIIGSIIKYLISLISARSPVILSSVITAITSGLAGLVTSFTVQDFLSKHKIKLKRISNRPYLDPQP